PGAGAAAAHRRFFDPRHYRIIIFDQRGTLYSEPFLSCPEYLELSADTLDDDLSLEESNRLSNQAADRCIQSLRDQGVDFGLFDSVENAADI
ncbi:MAG TPA: hypothetical protein PK954_26575, partial [Anaerolineales bacterium]|nr:hypothetical protein [Anaerolineales bacterium]